MVGAVKKFDVTVRIFGEQWKTQKGGPVGLPFVVVGYGGDNLDNTG
jgi:hypothetical protein